MSNSINTELLERAAECITYFEGKQPALLIERAMVREDLEAVAQLTTEAEAVMAQNEMEAVDIV